jgi:hypothetical protein
MANNQLRLDGLNELREALRNLPDELTSQASRVVEGAANAAAAEAKRNYPRGETGNLIAGVQVTHFDRGKHSAGAIVKNVAKHAHIFENGTQVRQTRSGANRGAMPPGHVFIPAVIRARTRMYQELMDLLQRTGLRVSGTP